MKENNIRILSTRPLGEALISKASQQNITIDIRSFIETKSVVDASIKEKIKELSLRQIAVVFTSMNGAEAVIETLKDDAIQPAWKVYCMGYATQTLVANYFTRSAVIAAGKNALELAAAIINSSPEQVAFFCGDQRRDELPMQLQASNIPVEEVVVYQTVETPATVDDLYNAILFFSPSAVRSFFTANKVAAHVVLFAIGSTTADTIRQYSNNQIVISNTPAKDALAEKAIEYLQAVKQP